MTLQIRGLRKSFGATVALAGVDLEVRAGEVHALIGENGAGKSTLLNILSGLFRQDGGTIELEGTAYAPRDAADARRSGIAHIHQELALCPHLSVAENIFMGIEPVAGGFVRWSELHERAAALLDQFGRSDLDPKRRVGELPLPDQQVVEICRALAVDARVILMDEPTSSLQREHVERLFRAIRSLRDRSISIIYVSHFLEELREIADRFTVLRDGASVGSGRLAEVSDSELIAKMVGRAVDLTVARDRSEAAAEVLLEVRNLSAPRVLSASFELRRGEILGIAGLIGSGRTELVRALFGLTPSTGDVVMRGRRVKSADPSSQIANGLGYLSEDRRGEGLGLRLPVADNVTMSRWRACARGGWINLRRQAMQTSGVIERLRIRARGPRVSTATLSGGNQQKVALGRLLHQDPDILLLDEPARGIDVGSKSDIYREITALAASGKAVLIVSSYLPELFAVCDRIAVMSRGRLSPARDVREWTPESVMEAAVGTARPTGSSVPRFLGSSGSSSNQQALPELLRGTPRNSEGPRLPRGTQGPRDRGTNE